MRCEESQQDIVLAQYGELPDGLQLPLEQHLNTCESCRREWNASLALHEVLALDPVVEPSPNLLAASRMRLEEALDALPSRTLSQQFFGNAFRWLGYVRGAPALTTLLLGLGFLGGNILGHRDAAKQAQTAKGGQLVNITHYADSRIASVSGIEETPNSGRVQVNYYRMVPETLQGPLDNPEIRKLLILGTQLATNNQAHVQSVALLSDECRAGHECDRSVLLTSLRYDRSPKLRLKALNGLQPYVAQSEEVRDAVLEAMMHDRNEEIRTQAISILSPVGADSSVRQALRTVSAEDANPAVRTASFAALQNVSDIE